jgi:chromosome condensin MukBEF MukE localization factor
MGIWNYESGRRYVTAFQFFRYNADGTLAGKQISRAQLQLSRDGNSYTTTVSAQVFDVNGNVIQNNCSTASATRFQ